MSDGSVVVKQASSHDNAFDLIRLVAAALVIVEHSWVLAGHDEPLPAGSGIGVGGIGVAVFFLISGFLVSASWLSDSSPRRFALRRFVRIYPGYLSVQMLMVFVLGPIVTTLSLSRYLADPGTWSYLGLNALILPMRYALPGVFDGLPQSNVVDGSLWSIRVEVLCYVGVVALGLLGVVRRRWLLVVLALAAASGTLVIAATGFTGNLVPHLLTFDAMAPIAFFLIGMVARAIPRVRRLPLWCSAVAVVAWLVSWNSVFAPVTGIAAVSLVTFTAAFRVPGRLRHPTGSYDLSYGTYLLGYPIQQLFVMAGLRTPWLIMVLTLGCVLPLAALSWRLVERPALRFKPRRPTVGPQVGRHRLTAHGAQPWRVAEKRPVRTAVAAPERR